MKKTKISLICLSACMVLGGFAGCRTNGNTDPTGTSGSDVTPTESVVDTSASASSEETSAVTETSASSQDTEPESSVENTDENTYVIEDFDQEYANTFITNFVEVFFYDYSRDTADTERILDFAHIHIKINARDSITYAKKGDLSYETFTFDKASSVASKYFGILLSEDECKKLPAPPSTYGDQPAGPFYEDGKIWYEAADGESHNLIGIVNSVTNNTDGTETIDFTIYSIELETYWQLDSSGMKKYYQMTPAKADADKTLTKVKTGRAVVGVGQTATYYLISYKTNG